MQNRASFLIALQHGGSGSASPSALAQASRTKWHQMRGRRLPMKSSMRQAMHEASIMQSALDSAMEELHKAGGDRITRMKLRVGVLSGVVPEALEFAFAALKAATPAAAAELKIEMAPAYFRCLDCKAMVERIEMTFVCPTCNGALIVDHGGRQLELTQLELN